MTKQEMRAESERLMADFLARGGKIVSCGRSARNYGTRELELMERGETQALANLQAQKAEQRADTEARRAQRG